MVIFANLHNFDHVVANFGTITHATMCIGCPVAWLISNKEDETTLEMFFKVIRERCPEAKVTTLMSDDGELYSAILANCLFLR